MAGTFARLSLWIDFGLLPIAVAMPTRWSDYWHGFRGGSPRSISSADTPLCLTINDSDADGDLCDGGADGVPCA